MLFRIFVVFFISLLTSSIFAVGSGRSPASPFHPYWHSAMAPQNLGGRQLYGSQGGSSSSSQTPRSLFPYRGYDRPGDSISPLLIFPPLAPLPPQSASSSRPSPIPLAVLPSQSASSSRPGDSISPLPILPPLAPLPPQSASSSRPSQPADCIVKDGEVIWTFSDEDILRKNAYGAFEEMLGFIEKNAQGRLVTLRIHTLDIFMRVVRGFDRNPTLYDLINHLEFHKLERIGTDMGVLIGFLKKNTPKLTKLSFIDSTISRKGMANLSSQIQSDKLLENIAQFEFIRVTIGIIGFSKLLQAANQLEELTHLRIDVLSDTDDSFSVLEEDATGQKSSLLREMVVFAVNGVQNKKLKSLSFAGQHFGTDIVAMDKFIKKMLEPKDNFYYPELEELNISGTGIPMYTVIDLLGRLNEQEEFLSCLKKLSIPLFLPQSYKFDALSDEQMHKIIKSLQHKRRHLAIVIE